MSEENSNGREQGKTQKATADRNGHAQDPFFIIYKGRSGSTYLADLLTVHPEIGIAPESNFVVSLWEWSRRGKRVVEGARQLDEALDLLYAEPKFATWEVPRAELRDELLALLPLAVGEVARRAVHAYCRRKYPSSAVRGVKKGSYAHCVPTVRALFPRAKFLLLVRDGRAVYASSKRALHSDRGRPFETDPVRSAVVWKRVVTALDRLPDPRLALQIQYERLLTEPEETLGKVLRFLGVGAEPSVIEAMLRPHEPAFVHERYSHLHPHVGKASQVSRIDGWRTELREDEIREFERVAGPTLASKGYEPLFKTSAWDSLRSALLERKIVMGWKRGGPW